MATIDHVIKAKTGMHARPAGMLVATAKKFKSTITVKFGGKEVSATKLFDLMKLPAKQNDTLQVCISGEDEEAATAAIKESLEKNF